MTLQKASVGKGNYSGGADDYNPAGYGETLTGNLWDNVSDNSKACLSIPCSNPILEPCQIPMIHIIRAR